MTEFVEWLNTGSEISPVLITGISQYQFVHIHPFLDGNGRTARVLCSLILYQEICDTTKRTATRDLTDLVNLGLLERHGEKKGTYYTLKLFEGQ